MVWEPVRLRRLEYPWVCCAWRKVYQKLTRAFVCPPGWPSGTCALRRLLDGTLLRRSTPVIWLKKSQGHHTSVISGAFWQVLKKEETTKNQKHAPTCAYRNRPNSVDFPLAL